MGKGQEYRRHRRVEEDIPVKWAIEDGVFYGEGIIRDISESGVLLEVDTSLIENEKVIFKLEAIDERNKDLIPSRAQLAWCKHMKLEAGTMLVGLEFVEVDGSKVKRLRKHVEKWFQKIASAANVHVLLNRLNKKG